MDDKRQDRIKTTLYLKISMIFGHFITTQIRVFLNGTDKNLES